MQHLIFFLSFCATAFALENTNKCGQQERNPVLDFVKPTDEQRGYGLEGVEISMDNSWPWRVLVIAFNDTNSQLKCAATLISENTAITSPRCVFNGENIKAENINVYLGLQNFTLSNITHTVMKRRVSKFKLIRKGGVSLAALTFSEKVNRNKSISPICLPSKAATPRQLCYATGWGLFDGVFERPAPGNPFKQSKVTIVPNAECQQKITAATMRTRLIIPNNDRLLSENQVCAGVSCSSVDMGGPLQCLVDGNWELHGVFDHRRMFLCMTSSPQIFTKVVKFVDEIKELLN